MKLRKYLVQHDETGRTHKVHGKSPRTVRRRYPSSKWTVVKELK